MRQPSRTALGAAALRAAHQTLDQGKIFPDPLAHRILGPEPDSAIMEMATDPEKRGLRLFMAARSRFAEDAIADCVARGVRQVAILGAGLDTFGLRNPYHLEGVRVFEVDHPATQAWKLQRLRDVGLCVPESLTFVAIDFEQQALGVGLRAAGVDLTRPTFFHWLGVVPYLRPAAVAGTLRFIASIPDSEIVFDYSEPLENYPPESRAALAAVGARAAAGGEPWLSFFGPAEISRQLHSYGFERQEDLGLGELAARYFGASDLQKGGAGPHVLRARRSN